MTQRQRLEYLINYLAAEAGAFSRPVIPADEQGARRLLRALLNVRPPVPADGQFLAVQDEYLRRRLEERGVTDISDLSPVAPDIYLWQGDITTLRCDGIVNAANSRMLGCFAPNHGCIDNAIHTYAGVQLRLECAAVMEAQGSEEPTGRAKITKGYNLPCKFVLHTVGPIVFGALRKSDCRALASCYDSCLALADENNLESIAFCCISTGEFHFPNRRAAEIAVETVNSYKERTGSRIKVVYNVFKDIDRQIYGEILGERKKA